MGLTTRIGGRRGVAWRFDVPREKLVRTMPARNGVSVTYCRPEWRNHA
jgi:hypothetical protein